MPVKAIATENAPKAIGAYSQAVTANDFVFVSGCIALDAKTNEFLKDLDVGAQARVALLNMKAILEEAGSGLSCIVKTTIYLTSMDDFQAVNGVYAEIVGGAGKVLPARAAVAVAGLPKGALVEMDCVAVCPE
eukprot:Nk52_evm4s32 gene=Nk52_evmTU4s32